MLGRADLARCETATPRCEVAIDGVVRFAAPNLALGNTVLIKHASNCQQSASALERLFTEPL
ncbi:hypothetical protein [Nocardia alba]|uniref:hypothetical protein n=1 Tax=Nocardia alba TaxID=225051 RepID=UPI00083049F1|nr:hypothetical protein [Nocardia alba]